MHGDSFIVTDGTAAVEHTGERVAEEARIEARNELVLRYRPYVFKVARDLAASIPCHLEVEDLASWGCLGLVEAAERYEPSRGVKFRSFAHSRIHGAMVDAIRAQLGRRTRESVSRMVTELRRVRCLAGDGSYSAEPSPDSVDDRYTVEGVIEGEPYGAPDRALFVKESHRLVLLALDTLSPIERTVIVRHYLHGDEVCVIAKRHNLSKSWLSRIHTRAIGKLRRRVRALQRPTPRVVSTR
jgi:RNA polymerase sigma factor for flagellar operon FliA